MGICKAHICMPDFMGSSLLTKVYTPMQGRYSMLSVVQNVSMSHFVGMQQFRCLLNILTATLKPKVWTLPNSAAM